LRLTNRQDFANPRVCPHIHAYPDLSQTVSQSYQADKIAKETDPRFLAPMWARGGQHFFIREIARLRSGAFIFMLRFFTHRGQDCVEAAHIVLDPTVRGCEIAMGKADDEMTLQTGEFIVAPSPVALIPMGEVALNCLDLLAQGQVRQFGG
jgi:hypothetical protein